MEMPLDSNRQWIVGRTEGMQMKAIILCGGQGTRLREHTELRPKPMVEIGGRPILWHIMKLYSHYGINDFVLCLGYKASVIKEYFLNYEAMNCDFTVRLGEPNAITLHESNQARENWRVTLADTGEETMTGARIRRAAKYLGPHDDTFMVTYGDGLADVNLQTLLEFHRGHGKLATLTGVRPPSRFGEFHCEGSQILSFSEKPQINQGLINGGFFCFQREFLNYLSESPDCILEKQPLETCASDGQLHVFEHLGYWHCMDTYRDWQGLENQWRSGRAPWAPSQLAPPQPLRPARPVHQAAIAVPRPASASRRQTA
jgi:glucose-1-phosphate cytidylyltransferase